MPVVFGVVAAVEGPQAFSVAAVDVARFAGGGVGPKDADIRLDGAHPESRGLPHEAGYGFLVVLAEHGWDGVPLGRKVEQGKKVQFFRDSARVRDVDAGNFVLLRDGDEGEVLEGQRVEEVQLAARVGVCGIAVEHGRTDVGLVGGACDVVAVCGGAHGKQKAAVGHVALNAVCDGAFELGNLGKAQGGGLFFRALFVFHVPGGVPVGAVEFAVLSGEVFVVQVQPLVLGQVSPEDFPVVNAVVGDFGVGEHQGDGVVPGLLAVGGVDGDFGGFFQQDDFRVGGRGGELRTQRGGVGVGKGFAADSADGAFAADPGVVGEHETAAAVIQEPLALGATLQGTVGEAVRLEVVGLAVCVHGDQPVTGPGGEGRGQKQQYSCTRAHAGFADQNPKCLVQPRRKGRGRTREPHGKGVCRVRKVLHRRTWARWGRRKPTVGSCWTQTPRTVPRGGCPGRRIWPWRLQSASAHFPRNRSGAWQ